MPEASIRLAIRDEYLECYRDEQLAWRSPITAILLIAEYTTNEGPYVDDYFVDLWSVEEGKAIRARTTFYATGRDAVFLSLATHLKADLIFGLTGSTEWASRIMWPPVLAGRPYLTFRELKPTTWRERLSHRFFGSTLECFLTEEVQAFLKQC